MNLLAILPILPGLGSLLSVLVALMGLGFSLLHPRGWKLWAGLIRSQWRGLLVLLLAGAGVYFGWRLSSAPPKEPESAPVQLVLDGWPTFQRSLSRRGSDDAPGPLAGGVHWTVRPEYRFLGAPAVTDDVVVAVGVFRETARCFCWDAETGRELWSGAPQGLRTTLSSPVLSAGRIYCGEGVHHTPQSRVYCLDPARGGDPVVWELTTRSHVECTPFLFEDRLYVNAGDDGVYCLRTGPDGNDVRLTDSGRIIWHVAGEDAPDVETALAVHGGRVYAGLGFDAPGIVAFNAASGEEELRAALPMPMFAPPALFAGGLLCGLGPGTLVDAATAGPGEARLVELDSLETRWRVPLSASMIQSAAVDGDRACFVSADGQVHVIDTAGRIERSWRCATPILAAPAVSAGHVYVVSEDGFLTALPLATLEPVWTVRLGEPGAYLGSPVVSGGRLFVGTPAGMMCVGRTRSEAAAVPAATSRKAESDARPATSSPATASAAH